MAAAPAPEVESLNALIAEAKREAHNAQVTQTSACLLKGFGEEHTLEELRERTRAEILQLRKVGLKEATALHPILYERVKLALAMRSS